MMNEHNNEQTQITVCLCVSDTGTITALRELIDDRLPDVAVKMFRDFREIKPATIDGPLLVLFSACEVDWTATEIDWRHQWFAESGVTALALTDSAEPGFVSKLFEAGVVDYFLDIPAGHVAAVARLAREIQKVEAKTRLSATQGRESLAERVRQATFRETVATINHHINNPLSELLATVEMLRLDGAEFEADSTLKARLSAIEHSARRIQRVTMRLLDLTDPSPHQTPAGGMIRLPAETSACPASRLTTEQLKLAKVRRLGSAPFTTSD